ncbi:hypothetical protein RM572_28360 [Streptomyces sp. DSM 42041]|uniref:Lipoprotein n=1 Tax=Streptomyces hazeniae TaxID=3075538 RepID=A0ABU2P433_9ACTN|nr:hypothetical protein [Streptomyces sp. DSM 42041]MDT0382668.1 hypothetical protein [Streptomyces sp. DSM 42041]
MRWNGARTAGVCVTFFLLIGTGAVAGCSSEPAGDRRNRDAAVRDAEQRSRRDERARQVAEAWDGSKAAVRWREGYYPMAAEVQLPKQGLRSLADKRAYARQNFVLRGELPAAKDREGRVRWEDGSSLERPLLGAGAVYETLDRNGSFDPPYLTVTEVELGEMALRTSRGPATVPAWLFTLKGYETPLKRAAVQASEAPLSPLEPFGPRDEVPDDLLEPVSRLVDVAADGRSVTVAALHGACDDGLEMDALETDGSVVLWAAVTGTQQGACQSVGLEDEVTVDLAAPLDNRVLLDAFTGRPVRYAQARG